jgi:2-isopropylmalate synthase
MWEVFADTYLPDDAGIRLLSSEITSGVDGTSVVAQLVVDGRHQTIRGLGNGPIDALVAGLSELGVTLEVVDYSEHALTSGSGASAVAYVEVETDGARLWGVGMDSSILEASLHAVISAANRARKEPTPA